MSLPDDDKSDYPDFSGDFSGENVDLELGDTSDSDSDGSEPNQVPNPGSDCGTREGGGHGPKGIYAYMNINMMIINYQLLTIF